jgi:hypothetical protein
MGTHQEEIMVKSKGLVIFSDTKSRSKAKVTKRSKIPEKRFYVNFEPL